MPGFRLRQLAREDLVSIGEYTSEHWSPAQAERYVTELYGCFARHADNPMLGRPYRPVAGYLRFEHASHIVFFRREENGDLVIVRILHKSMVPERHLHETEDE